MDLLPINPDSRAKTMKTNSKTPDIEDEDHDFEELSHANSENQISK